MYFSFRYKKEKVGKNFVWRPKIPVILSRYGAEIEFSALLDSGSDYTLLPKHVADALNLKISVKPEKASVVGGSVKTYRSSVNIKIEKGNRTIHLPKLPVNILEAIGTNGGLDDILLGRKPFFEWFNISFHENKKRVILNKVKRW